MTTGRGRICSAGAVATCERADRHYMSCKTGYWTMGTEGVRLLKMAEPPPTSPDRPHRMLPIAVGIAIGVGMVTGHLVGDALLPSLGYWGAFASKLPAAAVS